MNATTIKKYQQTEITLYSDSDAHFTSTEFTFQVCFFSFLAVLGITQKTCGRIFAKFRRYVGLGKIQNYAYVLQVNLQRFVDIRKVSPLP